MDLTNEPSGILSMIMVMGVTGAGKSYFINKLAGKQVVEEGASLNSCTQNCQLVPIEIGQKPVLVIDTPGFDDAERTDSEILKEIASILSAQYEAGVELKGVVYIHRITDTRFGRSAVKTFDIFKKICGDGPLKNVLLMTSRWNEVSSESLGSDRERDLREKFWAYMLDKGSNMSRWHGDHESATTLISQLVYKDTVTLQIQKELVDEGKTLDQTIAGSYVSDDIQQKKGECEEDLERLRQTLSDQGAVMKRKIQRDIQTENARFDGLQEQLRNLQKAVGADVRRQINKKRDKLGKFSRLLAPAAVETLMMFVGIPPGMTSLLYYFFPSLKPGSES